MGAWIETRINTMQSDLSTSRPPWARRLKHNRISLKPLHKGHTTIDALRQDTLTRKETYNTLAENRVKTNKGTVGCKYAILRED